MAVDLRKFGYAYEFGLQSDTERNGNKFNHNFDVHLQSHDKTRYQYHIVIDNKKSTITLTLPTRTMGIDANYHIPNDIFGKYDINFSTYFDAKKRTQIGVAIDLLRPTKNSLKNRIEMKFAYPGMRELKMIGETNFNGDGKYANGKFELDIFNDASKALIVTGKCGNNFNNDPAQTISMKNFNLTSELSVISKGLNIDYSFNGHIGGSINNNNKLFSIGGQFISPTPDLRIGIYLYGNENKFNFILIGFNEELINANGQYDANKMNGQLNVNYKIIGAASNNNVKSNLNINGMTSFIGQIEREKLIKINGEFSVGKESNIYLTSNDKEIFHAKIALDQTNFLTSEYKINNENLNEFTVSYDFNIWIFFCFFVLTIFFTFK